MAAYYNEIDPQKAAWLRELIKRNLIADGEVDERSIEDVLPADVAGFRQCHWFAGVGIWSYALRNAGWRDDRAVWTASCPCQPFSTAGPVNGFWRDAEWVYCRPEPRYPEGSYRAVRPGSFPLVDGAPARVVRLRGYGDGINAEVAKEFIGAYMQSTI